jgi:hypothetical protein
MNGESLSYEFDWRAEDHAAVTGLLVREQFRSGIPRLAKWVVVVLVAFAALVAAATAVLGDWDSTLRLAPSILALTVLMLGFGRLTGRLRAWQVGRSDPNVGHPFTYTLTDTGLRIKLRTVEAELKWAGMYRVRETPGMLLFYYNRRAAYFLPKREVGGPEALAILKQRIRERLPESVPFLEA